MRTFRNLSYALLFLAFICFFCLISFTQAKESMLVFTLLGVFIAMFFHEHRGLPGLPAHVLLFQEQ